MWMITYHWHKSTNGLSWVISIKGIMKNCQKLILEYSISALLNVQKAIRSI